MSKLIILRGLPGSGKTTYAKALITARWPYNVHICSADKYFERPDGRYSFNGGSELGFAHAWCQAEARRLMANNVATVVIDNTNSRRAEFQPYLDMAAKFGYSVDVIMIGRVDDEAAREYRRRGLHNVPKSTYVAMINRWEEYPGESLYTAESVGRDATSTEEG